MRRAALLPIALLLPLAACDSSPGTSISIKSDDKGGNTIAGMDGATGQVSIDTPGFKGNFTLPKIHLDAGDFDMNGVHLYPGSKISGMNVDAHDSPGKDKDSGVATVKFESPANPETVRAWFEEKLGKADFKLHREGTGLIGKTDEDKPFRLDLAPAGTDHAQGTITISG
ncbi:hypothetical protein BH09PSE4_BH09PSE4_20550 [soil metagenome]